MVRRCVESRLAVVVVGVAMRWVAGLRVVASGGLVRGMVVCVVLCVYGMVPAVVMAAGSDAGSTAAYLRALDGLAGAQAGNVGASVAAMEREASEIVSGCPSVLSGAPKGEQLSALGGEISAAVLLSSVTPDRTAMLAYAGKIAGLRWRERTVAKLVRMVVVEERATAKLVLPDVCADLREWVGSGYRTLSASTVGFLKSTEALGKETSGARGMQESLEEAVLRRLRPHENAADRRLARRANQLEESVGKRLLVAYARAFSRVAQALGVKSS